MAFAPKEGRFSITVEVVPPDGPEARPLLQALRSLESLPVDAFSVASNPVARPRMSALALASLIQGTVGRPAIVHCTTRDHNRLSLQSLLWGAKALGIEAVLAATGDFVALGERARTTTVRDLDVFALVRMAQAVGLCTGVVLDPHPESSGLAAQVRRLARKVEAGAQFAVTQPVYDNSDAFKLAQMTRGFGIPLFLGILPLWSARHARFLHEKVAGISIPKPVLDRMENAADPEAEGVAMAREMLSVAREFFSGACLMPPFAHYELMLAILTDRSERKTASGLSTLK